MIVVPYFEGDKSNQITKVQFEMYSYVSDSMRSVVRYHFLDHNSARKFFSPEQIVVYLKNENRDHRIMQGAHDLIAAVFRYRYKQGQFRKELFDSNKQIIDYFKRIYVNIDFLSRVPEEWWYLTKSWHSYAVESFNIHYDLIREMGYAHFVFDLDTQREERRIAEYNAACAIIKRNLDVPWTGHLHELQQNIMLSEDRN